MSCVFIFTQKTAYEMRISDWSSYVCSSDLSKPATGAVRPRTSAASTCAGSPRRTTSSRRRGRPELRPGADPPPLSRCDPAHHGIVGRRAGQAGRPPRGAEEPRRSEEHTSELQSLMRLSYAVFCLQTKKQSSSLH